MMGLPAEVGGLPAEVRSVGFLMRGEGLVVAASEQPLAKAAEVLVAVVLAGLHNADQTKPAGLVDWLFPAEMLGKDDG